MSKNSLGPGPSGPQARTHGHNGPHHDAAGGSQGEGATVPAIVLPWAPGGGAQLEAVAADAIATATDTAPGPGPRAAAAQPHGDNGATPLPYSLQAHLSLAVALDILSSQMQAVALGLPEETLSTITQALLAVRQDRPQSALDGLATEALADEDLEATGAALRALALGAVGEARAALAPALAACTQALGDAPDAASGVRLACAHVAEGAHEVIARARLALSAVEAKHAQGLKVGP